MILLNYSIAQEKLPEFFLQNGYSSFVKSVAFSPDGKTLASGIRWHLTYPIGHQPRWLHRNESARQEVNL